jgi:DNA-binding NtrC family response regulator
MTSKRSILIVDDELGVRESLRMILKPYYDIYTAPDGEAALNMIREQKFHLIAQDLGMPKLSGIETLREIRKIDPQVPVIIISGYGTQKDEKEALLYGVKDFIAKPFNASEIISVINGILAERLEEKGGQLKNEICKAQKNILRSS